MMMMMNQVSFETRMNLEAEYAASSCNSQECYRIGHLPKRSIALLPDCVQSGNNNTIMKHTLESPSGNFPLKLHCLLNTAAHEEGMESIVSWGAEGTTFKVHKIEQFVKTVLPRFFTKQTKYKSFQRQLVSSN
jgi:hypothetical protein